MKTQTWRLLPILHWMPKFSCQRWSAQVFAHYSPMASFLLPFVSCLWAKTNFHVGVSLNVLAAIWWRPSQTKVGNCCQATLHLRQFALSLFFPRQMTLPLTLPENKSSVMLEHGPRECYWQGSQTSKMKRTYRRDGWKFGKDCWDWIQGKVGGTRDRRREERSDMKEGDTR